MNATTALVLAIVLAIVLYLIFYYLFNITTYSAFALVALIVPLIMAGIFPMRLTGADNNFAIALYGLFMFILVIYLLFFIITASFHDKRNMQMEF